MQNFLGCYFIVSMTRITEVLVVLIISNGCLALISKPSEVLPVKNFAHRVVLDQDGAFIMLWTPHKDKIEFEVQVSNFFVHF